MLELIAKFKALIVAAQSGDVWVVVELLHEFVGIALSLRKQPMAATPENQAAFLAAIAEGEAFCNSPTPVGSDAVGIDRERLKRFIEFAMMILKLFI